MSTPVTAQGTWTRKELEGFNRRQVEQAAKVCLQYITSISNFVYAPWGLPPYITSPILVDTFSFIAALRVQDQWDTCRAHRTNSGIATAPLVVSPIT